MKLDNPLVDNGLDKNIRKKDLVDMNGTIEKWLFHSIITTILILQNYLESKKAFTN